MQGKPRPAATVQEALSRMDRYVALGIVGQQEVAQLLGLNVTDLTCLGHILGAGKDPLGAGDLAELTNLTTGAVTGVLNRLERAGYASRQPDPADRRRVRVVAEPPPPRGSSPSTSPSTPGSARSSPNTPLTRSPSSPTGSGGRRPRSPPIWTGYGPGNSGR